LLLVQLIIIFFIYYVFIAFNWNFWIAVRIFFWNDFALFVFKYLNNLLFYTFINHFRRRRILNHWILHIWALLLPLLIFVSFFISFLSMLFLVILLNFKFFQFSKSDFFQTLYLLHIIFTFKAWSSRLTIIGAHNWIFALIIFGW